MKSSLKPFKIDQNQLTGLRNFTEISKDPLALPAYALPETAAASTATQSQREQQKAEIKAKRPDDKADRDSKVHHRKAQEERGAGKKLAPLENRLAPAKQPSVKQEQSRRDEAQVQDVKAESNSVHTAEPEAGPPSNDLFYKKDSDRHLLSGNEDDIDEIVSEVKPHKKVNKVTESDFETDTVPANERPKQGSKQADKDRERDRDIRNSKKGPVNQLSSTDQVSKRNNNFVSERTGSRRPKKNLAEDSMTEQSEDERRFEPNQRRPGDGRIKLSSGSRGTSNLYPAQQRIERKTAGGGNITNIINNNNINNYIINDPSKAPPVFHMAQTHPPMGDPRLQPGDGLNNAAQSDGFAVRQNTGQQRPKK